METPVTPSSPNKPSPRRDNPAAFLVALMLCAGLGLVATSFIIAAIGTDSRPKLLLGTVVQDILVFLVPAFLAARFSGAGAFRFLGLRRLPGVGAFMLMIFAMMAVMPLINQVGAWNNAMRLPQSMASLENTLRALEDSAQATTGLLLGDTSVGSLFTGILVIGLLTGFCEEVFFRGAVQGFMQRNGFAPWVAIWLAALVFSALHFQFYGFVPRLLLGALFGYFYAYGGSLWTGIAAHALNNTLVVVVNWLQMRGSIGADVSEMGAASGFPWGALASAAITVFIMLVYCRDAGGKPSNPLK